MARSAQVDGIYLKKITRVVGGGIRKSYSVYRGYALLSYRGQEIGRVAISHDVYEAMRADGATVLLNGGRK